MKENRISVKTKEATQKLPPCSCKFFGNPDMWDGFAWPEYTDADGACYCMDFICQINCAELAPFDVEGFFPKHGMLYFFYPLEDTPFFLHGGDPVCYYYNGDLGKLQEFVLVFDDGTDAATAEQKIEFSREESRNESEYPDHHLLGEASMEPFDGDTEGLEGMILLFELYSFQTKDRTVSFWDDGTLQFYIHPDKLKAGDVSSVQVRLNTT